MVSGRRYATYDSALYLLGISITPATAQLLAFGVAPVLMGLSTFLIFRDLQNRRRIAAAEGRPD
jgi:drug/metabolite transporter (DMT)-like permease